MVRKSKKLKNKNKKNKSRRKFRMKLISRKRSAPHSSVSVKRQKSKTCPKIILSGRDNFHLLEAMNNPLNPIEKLGWSRRPKSRRNFIKSFCYINICKNVVVYQSPDDFRDDFRKSRSCI